MNDKPARSRVARSDTPLTDAFYMRSQQIPEVPADPWDFARKLERDRAELVEALQAVVTASDQFIADTGMKHGDLLTDAVDAARAAIARATAKG